MTLESLSGLRPLQRCFRLIAFRFEDHGRDRIRKAVAGALNGKAQIAAALSAVEARPASMAALARRGFREPQGLRHRHHGPPGAGKSTLINALIAEWRRLGKTVAVLAVDPSSRASGGALLGDRVRMRTDPGDDGVFIRSIAARGRLGGLADIAYPAAALLRALYDKVIVESVGVGQSETDIATVSDTVVLVHPAGVRRLAPIHESGHRRNPRHRRRHQGRHGRARPRALADLKGALACPIAKKTHGGLIVLVVSLTSGGAGLRQLFAAFDNHEAWLAAEDRLAAARSTKAQSWVQAEVLSEFGRRGLDAVPQELFQSWNNKPFATDEAASRRTRHHSQTPAQPPDIGIPAPHPQF